MTLLTPAARTANPFAAYAALTGAEIRRFARSPMQAMATVFFPVFFFALFGLDNLNGKIAGANAGQYIIVNYATYSLMSAALFTFGVGVAGERAMGWYQLLRVAPLSALQQMAAKFTLAMLAGAFSMTVLFLFAVLVGHVAVPLALAMTVMAKLLAGSVAFVALGFALGFLLSPNAAAPVVNVFWLLLSFGSGLFIPLQFAPQFIRSVAPYLPSYHLAQLGWGTVGAQPAGRELSHWLWLAGYTLVFVLIGVWAYRRDERRNNG